MARVARYQATSAAADSISNTQRNATETILVGKIANPTHPRFPPFNAPVAGNVDQPGGRTCNDVKVGGVTDYTADCIPSDGISHSVGAIRFASDGTLFVSIGDGSDFNKPTDNALRAQNPNSLSGKILRINRDGQAVAGNPFFGSGTGQNPDPNSNRAKIWATGLRNPFRFALRPPGPGCAANCADMPVLGDVGWETREEVNVVPAAANLGWPCFEGTLRQSGWSSKPECQNLLASQTRAPLIEWDHNRVSAAAIGGTFVTGTNYPAAYQGSFFYADYSLSKIFNVRMDNNFVLQTTLTPLQPGALFADNAEAPVDLQMGPDGNVYYLAIATGALLDGPSEVRRIKYSASGNSPPSVNIGATPNNSNSVPLTVNFNSTGTVDPEGNPMTYTRDYGYRPNGTPEGTAGPFTNCTPTVGTCHPAHSFTQAGVYEVTLIVTDSVNPGIQRRASTLVWVGNAAPVPTVTKTMTDPNPDDATPCPAQVGPVGSLLVKVGDFVCFDGSATDQEDGAVPPDRLLWRVILKHCPSGACHNHFFDVIAGMPTAEAPWGFDVPDHGDEIYFELRFEATATGNPLNALYPPGNLPAPAVGRAAPVQIHPQKVNITLASNPPGIPVAFDSSATARPSPLTHQAMVGTVHVIIAPQTIGTCTFQSWTPTPPQPPPSPGQQPQPANQPLLLVGNAAATYTANYTPSGCNPQPALTVVKAGSGSGTVTSSPAGINCGATCTANYAPGTVVTLTATPAAGSVFGGWSGGGCTGTGTCQVTLNATQSVTATFTALPVLTVARVGTGNGTVASNPAGINCGTTCSATYATGTVVTLTATPATGSIFAGWSGACTGTGTCTVTMNAAQNVTATFNITPGPCTTGTVGVTVAPDGTGQLQVRITARTGQIAQIRQVADDTRVPNPNAIFRLPDGSQPTTLNVTPNTSQYTFHVRPANPAAAVTVPLRISDGCGTEWATLVGGGSAVFTGPAAAPSEVAVEQIGAAPTAAPTPSAR